MDYSVVIHKGLENKSAVSIVDDNWLPACFFLSNHLRTTFAERAFNTQLAYGKILLFIFRYFTTKSIDLPERVASGQFFTAEEYDDFKRHCKYKVETELEEESNVVSLARFSGKQIDNLIHATQSTESRVAANTVKMRLTRFIGYIQYLYETYHFANNPPVSVSQDFADLERKVRTDIRLLQDENADVSDPFEQAIPDETFFKILEIIKPASPDNPWGERGRLRNQLIIDIFIEAGIRLGAMDKLKISDIKENWAAPRLMVTRTPNDPTDPRKKKSAQKTKAHAAAISPETLKLLKLYIDTERSKYPEAETHDFIFVGTKGDSKGLPITDDGVYKVIKKLSKVVGFKLNPHKFRHKWNEIFDQKATEAGFTPEQIEDIRKYAMGWVEDSKMSGVYNAFRHAVKVHELSAKRQQETVSPQGQGKSNGDN